MMYYIVGLFIMLLVLIPASSDSIVHTIDEHILAKTIYYEAGGQPRTAKKLVGETVLNRTASPLFPDTIPGVVYQTSPSRQFSFTNRDTPNMDVVYHRGDVSVEARVFEECLDIAVELLAHYHPNKLGVLYFHSTDIKRPRSIQFFARKSFHRKSGRMLFYKEPQ